MLHYSLKNKNLVSISGIGLHSGQLITAVIQMGEPDTGVVFHRTDINKSIQAMWSNVHDTKLCTCLIGPDIKIGTIEHFMAALWAHNLKDVRIELNGPEMPILDGSSLEYMKALRKLPRGPVSESRVIQVLKTVEISGANGSWMKVEPAREFSLDVTIDFANEGIGRSGLKITQPRDKFGWLLASARTFVLLPDVQNLKKMGLALGGSLDNAIVVDQDGSILNPEGLRFENEFVRHKALDILGDLSLAGYDLQGKVTAYRPGHSLTNMLLGELLNGKSWKFSDDKQITRQLELA
jgi:UDP-3-O-[3-hydroxymyristoyl] N-acetylglucosamine deacetylase